MSVAALARRSIRPDDAATVSPDARRLLKLRRLMLLAMVLSLAPIWIAFVVVQVRAACGSPPIALGEKRVQFFFARRRRRPRSGDGNRRRRIGAARRRK